MSKYQIPEKPQKPGEFQWEALDDVVVADLITTKLDKHIDFDKIQAVRNMENKDESLLLDHLRKWGPFKEETTQWPSN